MRKRLSVVALAFIITTLSFGQQNSLPKADIDGLLVKLSSGNIEVREQAYEKLKSDPTATRSKKVKAALVALLDRENEELHYPSQPTSDADSGEGPVEYINELSDTVYDIADWDDPSEVCLLVRNNLIPPSHSPSEAATREGVAWPCLKQMSVSERILERIDASLILVKMSAKAGDALDPAIAQGTKQVLVRALHDEDDSVRSETVKSLKKYGTEAMIPALRQVAESDPATDKITHNFFIREYAAKAIAEIQKRAGQYQTGAN